MKSTKLLVEIRVNKIRPKRYWSRLRMRLSITSVEMKISSISVKRWTIISMFQSTLRLLA